ncbi:MAG TPA: DUF4127 family protein [Aggregatilinea sp.]|uniref:DUF4127 family protein n=1 Tax=Aggregatilinea sp. TaxID=2806333 RepID=UPI002C7E582C|nr:DUF4127 family protein [Aggregatilinea sp.]HML21456.1 DUF4127 family protein [Aggregatilinea sp.]
MRIGLIPLDERPVNTRYPVLIGQIAGAEVLVPPPEALSRYRTPAIPEALAQWIEAHAPTLDALIVSVEMLGYGGLIASRITDESAGAILERLNVLRALRTAYPALTIYGFNVITRISRHNDATEEPIYWAEYGSALFRLSQMMDRAARGEQVGEELDAQHAAIPAEYVRDFLDRRGRNHQINLAALNLLADDTLDLLVLSSDDTSEYGLSSQEKRALHTYAGQLGLGDGLLMYPGADEVGCALVARLVNHQADRTPRFQPAYIVPGGDQIVAAFEDGPIRTTVERQIRAAGAQIVDGDPDVLLIVNPPLGADADWPRSYSPEEEAVRLLYLEEAINQIAAAVEAGQRVAVADVAHANGADAALIERLRARVPLDRLAAYGAWNTAGNTIGTVVAQACAALYEVSPDQQAAQRRFLAHRFIEDWAYQRVVRDEIRDWLDAESKRREPSPDLLDATRARIEAQLAAKLADLPDFEGLALRNVRLPWDRTFEVDFDLDFTTGQR